MPFLQKKPNLIAEKIGTTRKIAHKVYNWVKTGTKDIVYYIHYESNKFASIRHEDGKWKTYFRWDEDNGRGEFDSKEDAFKEIDGIVYRKNKDMWFVTIVHPDIKPIQEMSGYSDELFD